MPRIEMQKRAAKGNGSIRKRTQTIKGREYTSWVGRYTIGYDPDTGKQIQKTISGKSQKEVAQRLRNILYEIDTKQYRDKGRFTVKEWLEVWLNQYVVDVKPYTKASYKRIIVNYLIPKFGSLKLEDLAPHEIQMFYNSLREPEEEGKTPLAIKTVRNIHGVFHSALDQAVKNGYIRTNPCNACKLPRAEKKEMQPMNNVQIKKFLEAIEGHRFKNLFTVTLFTGMRQGEVLGLKWDCVNFNNGTILIDKQLQREHVSGGDFVFRSPKNGKSRTLRPAPLVMDLLKDQKARQAQEKKAAGDSWEDHGLVFTTEFGRPLPAVTVFKQFKAVVTSIGMPEVRFHDLRHTYAVSCIRAGDDIKTVQVNLGHATAAFTMEVYAHATEDMKKDSADRMDTYITDVLKLDTGK